jgi:hypothetical protein
MVRTALAALSGALVVTAGAVVFTGVSGAAGPSPVPIVQAAQATCVTDGGGLCTVTHSLGAVPEAIVVSPNTPNPLDGFMLNTVQGSFTATTFQVRAMVSQTTPKTFGQIWFSYAAYAAAAAPPATITPSTTPPITTTRPTTPTPTTVPTTPTISPTPTITPTGGGS